MRKVLVGKAKVSLFSLCRRPYGSLRSNDSAVVLYTTIIERTVLGLDSASGDRKE